MAVNDKRIGNKFALGLTTNGRPPIYENSEEGTQKMYDRILSYFEYIKGESHKEKKHIKTEEGKILETEVDVWDREPEQMTITGLSIYLGFSSKGTLYEYAKKKDFSDCIKRALLFVEQHYEEMLLSKASTGAIFALKNMGWTDKTESTQTNINYDATVSKEEAKAISDALDEEV